MEPIKRVKNDIDFDKVEENLLSVKTQLVLDWFAQSISSVRNIIQYDWSDDVGSMDNVSDTEKAQSLADWIVRKRSDLSFVLYNESLERGQILSYEEMPDFTARQQLFLRKCLKKFPAYAKKELLIKRILGVLAVGAVMLVFLSDSFHMDIPPFVMKSIAGSMMILLGVFQYIVIPRKAKKLVAEERWKDNERRG